MITLGTFLVQTLEKTVQAFEHTARECEKAARGVERATLVFQLDVPHALGSIERAGNEIENLGRSFNIMGGCRSKKDKPKEQRDRNSSVPIPGEDLPPEMFGRTGMQRVVQDISSMTMVQHPPGSGRANSSQEAKKQIHNARQTAQLPHCC